ncbi:hypothetical protein AAG570_000574 [Ranatra chinensis]|uniref:Uncharacterized protein n=1 Tax=Ranatra chinensis TaxID=642074 RepID=A0ABD0YZI1_9HEMI
MFHKNKTQETTENGNSADRKSTYFLLRHPVKRKNFWEFDNSLIITLVSKLTLYQDITLSLKNRDHLSGNGGGVERCVSWNESKTGSLNALTGPPGGRLPLGLFSATKEEYDDGALAQWLERLPGSPSDSIPDGSIEIFLRFNFRISRAGVCITPLEGEATVFRNVGNPLYSPRL